MLGELIPCGGGDPVPLLQPQIRIGRRSNCDIVLEFPNVSSNHCELELVNGYWRVRDLRSRNGVKVNGERVDIKFLQPGDELSIAKHRFEIQYQPTGDGPPPEEEDDDPFSMSLLERAGLEKRREEERKLSMPPAARRNERAEKPQFSKEEEDAVQWLMDDA